MEGREGFKGQVTDDVSSSGDKTPIMSQHTLKANTKKSLNEYFMTLFLDFHHA